ncbi:hypothetical protein Ahy_B02g058930 [Arachis hypogaea]|uniref:Aminotransferase-like plant mobile domain-containing protein n=1 Tax=Arachis hypogaea TaxID=3818 RepID=A0A445AFR2_ARAHY|nr:hypothetical protein Ahy_B02g058930 [Arachis hypogaea]
MDVVSGSTVRHTTINTEGPTCSCENGESELMHVGHAALNPCSPDGAPHTRLLDATKTLTIRKLRMLTCDHPLPPDRYNDWMEDHLRVTGFYHASQIGVVQNQKALVNALIERWHPDTHTFHLPVGECAVTLEDVALILGLPNEWSSSYWDDNE